MRQRGLQAVPRAGKALPGDQVRIGGRYPLQPRDQAVNIAEHEQVAHLDDLVLRYARDTKPHTCLSTIAFFNTAISFAGLRPFGQAFEQFMICLLYTSDAADDLTRVDLGGR